MQLSASQNSPPHAELPNQIWYVYDFGSTVWVWLEDVWTLLLEVIISNTATEIMNVRCIEPSLWSNECLSAACSDAAAAAEVSAVSTSMLWRHYQDHVTRLQIVFAHSRKRLDSRHTTVGNSAPCCDACRFNHWLNRCREATEWRRLAKHAGLDLLNRQPASKRNLSIWCNGLTWSTYIN